MASADAEIKRRPIALVTGAARGIGRAVALQLARDGHDVAFCYRAAREAAQELERAVAGTGARVFSRAVDVADFDAAEQLVDAVENEFGEIDVLVNNAGIIKDAPLVLMDRSSWTSVLQTNLDGVFHVCRRAVFHFIRRRRGVVINLSSVAGVYGNPGQTNYSASKAGIIGLSKSLAKEVGAYGIRVNVVAPGFINTDMTKDLNPKVVQRVLANIPLRKVGEPEDVAELVSFLASDRARYITAQTIHVDGGVLI